MKNAFMHMPSEDDVSIKILRSIACFALSHIFWDAFLEAYSSEEALMFLGKTGCKNWNVVRDWEAFFVLVHERNFVSINLICVYIFATEFMSYRVAFPIMNDSAITLLLATE